MADISKIKINNVNYDIKDAKCRAELEALIGSDTLAGDVDTIKEIQAFLANIDTDDPTLFNQLKAINDRIGAIEAVSGTVDDALSSTSANPVQNKVIKGALDGKVDAETGKSLMTDAEHTKLAGIAAGAEVNVQSDWNATSGDALILNKPTIPTVPTNVSSFTNDANYQTASNVIASLADVYDGYDSTTETLSFTFPTE